MRQTTFGRTGMRVSIMGLGGGGPSRLGTRAGNGAADCQRVVHAAVDGGINVFDSSESYGTEKILGNALKDVPRDDVVICTKLHGAIEGQAKNLQQVEATLDQSLANLQADSVDVYMLHAVGAKRYDAIAVPLVPSLEKLKAKGKIRAIGITECFGVDRNHKMLTRALADDWYDVIMVGFNILNTSARGRILDAAQRQNVGVFDMFAVRRAMRDIASLTRYLQTQIEQQQIHDSAIELVQVIREGMEQGEYASVSELAYRYCLQEAGIDCVLTGTGSLDHLRENIAAADKGPIDAALCLRLNAITESWDHLSAQ